MPPPVMPYVSGMVTRPNTVSALREKRGEIAGQIDALQDQLRQAMIDLEHVDATLVMFDPDIVLEQIKPKPLPPRAHAFKGQVSRGILETLRKEGTMDGRALTIRLMAQRDLNPNDKALAKAMQKRIGSALRDLRNRGLVLSEKAEGDAKGLLRWSIAS